MLYVCSNDFDQAHNRSCFQSDIEIYMINSLKIMNQMENII